MAYVAEKMISIWWSKDTPSLSPNTVSISVGKLSQAQSTFISKAENVGYLSSPISQVQALVGISSMCPTLNISLTEEQVFGLWF